MNLKFSTSPQLVAEMHYYEVRSTYSDTPVISSTIFLPTSLDKFTCSFFRLANVPGKRTKPAKRIQTKKDANRLSRLGILSSANSMFTYLVAIWLRNDCGGGRVGGALRVDGSGLRAVISPRDGIGERGIVQAWFQSGASLCPVHVVTSLAGNSSGQLMLVYIPVVTVVNDDHRLRRLVYAGIPGRMR